MAKLFTVLCPKQFEHPDAEEKLPGTKAREVQPTQYHFNLQKEMVQITGNFPGPWSHSLDDLPFKPGSPARRTILIQPEASSPLNYSPAPGCLFRPTREDYHGPTRHPDQTSRKGAPQLLPHARGTRSTIREEMENVLQLRVIKDLHGAWSSPFVHVTSPDATY